ncbi:reverse transcriptase domain-containing protein [Tanacetum coccineum]
MPSTDQPTITEGTHINYFDPYTTAFPKILTMSEAAELNLSPPTSAVRNTMQKENEQTSKNPKRPALGGKGKSVSAHSESSYQISRSERTKSVPRKRHHGGTYSRKTEMLSESEDSGGGYWKSRAKKPKSNIEEDDLSQPWVYEETDIFTPRIHYFDFPKKTRMSNNVKTYDGSDDPEDHLIFQVAAKVERWAMPTWCHMFNSTLTVSARVWFDDLPLESIDSYDDLKKAILANFLQQKKNQHRSEHRSEKFTILIKSRKEILALDKAWKLSHVIKELKQGSGKDQPKEAKKGETSEKDKAMAIMMVQPWQRVARQRIIQRFSPDPEISFPPLGDEDRTEGPMIIEAEIEGHFVHRIYVDRGPASKILYEHCFNRLRPEVKNQMVSATAPLIGFSQEIIWPMGQILLPVKIWDANHSTSIWMNFVVYTKCKIPGSRRNSHFTEQQDNPTRMHDGLLTGSTAFQQEGLKALCELIKRNHDIFTWKPEDVTGVLRHLAKHRLNFRKGCLPVRQKKRIQAPERNKEIQEEVRKLVDAGIMKEVHYRSWLSDPEFGGVYRRFGDQDPYETRDNKGYQRNVQDSKRDKHEAESQKIHLRGGGGHVLGRQAKWEVSKPKQIHVQVSRKVIAIFQNSEEVHEEKPKTSVKGQILADFIVERPEDDSLVTTTEVEEELLDPWTLFANGSSCVDGFGAGLILMNLEGTEFTYALRFRFDATNNKTKYEALIAGLRIAEQMGVKKLQANMDSRLVANQVNGSYIAKDPGMIQ